MVQFQSLESVSLSIKMVCWCEVPRSLNCEYFSISPPGGPLESSRYGNVRSNVGIIYEEGHVNAQKENKERGMKVLVCMLMPDAALRGNAHFEICG